jgi:hypothetical protein
MEIEKMSKETEMEYVKSKIDNEGMWYCFDGYSDFRDIEDSRFHELRIAFCEAGEALTDYVEEDRAKKSTQF